jgi:GcrA cell cycle regulator
MVWTDEMIDTLKQGFRDRQIASQIAASLNVSRNAVIGKINRLGLKLSEQDLEMRRSHKGRKLGPRQRRAGAQTAPVRAPTRWLADTPIIEPTEPVTLAPDESPHAVSLFDVEPHQCRWPLGEAGKDFRFCGAGIELGSYCGRHARVALRG